MPKISEFVISGRANHMQKPNVKKVRVKFDGVAKRMHVMIIMKRGE